MEDGKLIIELIKGNADKLDGIAKVQAEQGVLISENAKDIAHHIERTDKLEDRIEQTKDYMDLELRKHNIAENKRFEALEEPKAFKKKLFNKSWKIFLALGSTAGVIYALVRLYDFAKLSGWI